MKKIAKGLVGATTAGAMMLASATPAAAGHRDRDDDGISAGEVIAGAVILGGIAAVLSGKDRGYDRDYDRGYRGGYDDNYSYGYRQRYGGSRSAVDRCVNAVEGWANRYSRSKVTEIRDIDRTRYGYKVEGKLVVRDGWRGRDRYERYDRYDRGNRYDRYDNRYGRGYERGYDKGRFTCYVERGRVVDIDYRGLDNWR